MIFEDEPIVAQKKREFEAVDQKVKEHECSELVSKEFVCGACGSKYHAEFKGNPDSMEVTPISEGEVLDKKGPCVYRVPCECGVEHQIDVDCNPMLFRVVIGA